MRGTQRNRRDTGGDGTPHARGHGFGREHGLGRIGRLIAGVLLTAACLTSAACGIGMGGNGSADGGASGGATVSGGTPTFSGPYADDFKREYDKAPTDLARGILRDGKITDAEVQEVYDAYNTCLEPYGLQATYSADAGETVAQYRGSLTDDEQLDIMKQCHAKTDAGNISSLYVSMRRNPERLDTEAMYRATYRCLVKHDLLPAPISEDDYISTMTAIGAKGDNAGIEANLKREMEFFSAYYQTDFDGNPNPNFQYGQNTDKGRLFYECGNDPLNQ